ncbi:hypothetical protein D9758_006193 [Tetrapyrgos nigripes]|uniref:MULE transposase domain-containing protein n=1 Tax=Tetrapyrgos nigripes TaxID=182062 RepID=A0A8H5GAV7_9AGAR|nr:hypothetical protein D9758_006193 [Tetrapyrgos nigripes]
MHTFDCKGWLSIKIFEGDPCAWIHLKHKEDHILYDGSVLPEELWTEILKRHPKPLFKCRQVASIASEARRKQWCRDPDELKSAKIILDEFNLPSVEGYSGIAFSLPDVLLKFGGTIREIALDSAWNTNGSKYELYALLGESGEAGVKEDYICSFLEHFKARYDLNPSFTLSDKDLSEINAFLKAFPEAKHQLCFWHCLRAVKQQLSILQRPPKFYNVTEARNEFGDAINKNFVPVGQVTEADRVNFAVAENTIPRLVPVQYDSPTPDSSDGVSPKLDDISWEEEDAYTHDPEFSEFFNNDDADNEFGPDWMFDADEKPSKDPNQPISPIDIDYGSENERELNKKIDEKNTERRERKLLQAIGDLHLEEGEELLDTASLWSIPDEEYVKIKDNLEIFDRVKNDLLGRWHSWIVETRAAEKALKDKKENNVAGSDLMVAKEMEEVSREIETFLDIKFSNELFIVANFDYIPLGIFKMKHLHVLQSTAASFSPKTVYYQDQKAKDTKKYKIWDIAAISKPLGINSNDFEGCDSFLDFLEATENYIRFVVEWDPEKTGSKHATFIYHHAAFFKNPENADFYNCWKSTEKLLCEERRTQSFKFDIATYREKMQSCRSDWKLAQGLSNITGSSYSGRNGSAYCSGGMDHSHGNSGGSSADGRYHPFPKGDKKTFASCCLGCAEEEHKMQNHPQDKPTLWGKLVGKDLQNPKTGHSLCIHWNLFGTQGGRGRNQDSFCHTPAYLPTVALPHAYFAYPAFHIASAPKGTQACALDIKKFHRTVPALPHHKPYLIVQDLHGKFFVDHCIPFGCASASSNAGMIANATIAIWAAKGMMLVKRCEDDFKPLRTPTGVKPNISGTDHFTYDYDKARMLSLIEHLGIPWHSAEDKGDAERLTVLL